MLHVNRVGSVSVALQENRRRGRKLHLFFFVKFEEVRVVFRRPNAGSLFYISNRKCLNRHYDIKV